MQKITEHISKVNNKLQELLKKHASLVKECELQQKNMQKLKAEIELKDQRINTLEQHQHILRSAAGKMNDKDRKEFELLINKYIREIDKCIHLLNE